MYSNSSILSVLYGTWQLINITQLTNGTLQNSTASGVGTQPAGLLQYLSNGYMSANLMATEPSLRPADIDWPRKTNDSDADWSLVGMYTLSYAGKFSLNVLESATKGQMFHGPMTMANVPKWVGSTQTRNFTFWEGEAEKVGGQGRVRSKGAIGDKGTVLQIGNEKCFLCGLWWVKIS
ncbi:Lipocalin-like domain-containing protein [Lophiotrema nucula]|uniref:Lipocalin-like domain-containing protein n=1 Tax=Lophiotrema nucula TaxID=690887 RepID=A0A6A5YN96_9PLEO|nr:Lipocalin-like domain-containing protein [Lophiotrema nucula]